MRGTFCATLLGCKRYVNSLNTFCTHFVHFCTLRFSMILRFTMFNLLLSYTKTLPNLQSIAREMILLKRYGISLPKHRYGIRQITSLFFRYYLPTKIERFIFCIGVNIYLQIISSKSLKRLPYYPQSYYFKLATCGNCQY